jgi:bacillithiol synthase
LSPDVHRPGFFVPAGFVTFAGMRNSYTFDELALGSTIVRDLGSRNVNIAPFVSDFYSIPKAAELAGKRNFDPNRRSLLVQVLKDQSVRFPITDAGNKNIALLASANTFTITTGHQLNLLTGPLFSIIKIAQVIVIAEQLRKEFPEFNFVPVFWMATEDHDFAEINHLHLFGKKIEWQDLAQENIIAGELKTAAMNGVLDEIESLFGNEQVRGRIAKLTTFYRGSSNLADATRGLINELFGDSGLVIIDGNDAGLKQAFKPVLLREIREELVFRTVSATNAQLEEKGYHQQVYVRPCNLFFIHANGRRERIVKENDLFKFDNQTLSAEETCTLIENNPEHFSPNALLRPVYQESVLPNVVTVGGAGEMAYWLQLKATFDALSVPFPLLRTRDSLVVLTPKNRAELDELSLELNDLIQPLDVLLKKRILEHSSATVDLSEAQKDLLTAKNKVLEKTLLVDKNLATMVEAEFVKMLAALEKIEAKLVKTEKDKDQSAGKKIAKLQEKIFPEHHLHERRDNFIAWYADHPGFIKTVVNTLSAEAEPKIRALIL